MPIPNKLGERTLLEDVAVIRTLLVMDHVSASTNAAQSIPNNTTTTVIFEDEDYDTNSEYVAATGIFTAKRSGYLQVSSLITFAATATWIDSERILFYVYKNLGAYRMLQRASGFTATSTYAHAQGTVVVPLAIGDTVTVRVNQNSGAALALLNDGRFNYVQFDWLA